MDRALVLIGAIIGVTGWYLYGHEHWPLLVALGATGLCTALYLTGLLHALQTPHHD